MRTDDGSLSPDVSPFTDAISRHQVLAFLTVTLATSWSFWAAAAALARGNGLSRGLLIPGAFGPPIAAILVTWASGDSVRGWLGSLVRWRVPRRWYVIVVGLPAATAFVGVGGALVLTGHSVDPLVISDRIPLFAISFVVALLVGGGQEELGWRGFLLPRLQETYGALLASVMIGVVWAVWHLPLFLLEAPRNETGSFLLYTVLVIGLSVLFTWCYNSTGGSLLLAMGLHAGFNASGMFIPAPFDVSGAAPLVSDVGMITGVWIATVAVVLVRDTATLSPRGYPGSGGRSEVEQAPDSAMRSTDG